MAKYLTLLALLGLPFSAARADAYKCVSKEGKVSFAAVPCPPDQGDASFEAKTKTTRLKSVSAADADPKHINEQALKVLQSPTSTRWKYNVKIIPAASQP